MTNNYHALLYHEYQLLNLAHHKLLYLNSLLLDEIHTSKKCSQMYCTKVDIPITYYSLNFIVNMMNI